MGGTPEKSVRVEPSASPRDTKRVWEREPIGGRGRAEPVYASRGRRSIENQGVLVIAIRPGLPDDSVLYVCADKLLTRIKTKTKGTGFW